MNRAGLFQAMEGGKEPSVSQLTFSAQSINRGRPSFDLGGNVNKYNKVTYIPNIFPQVIDYSQRNGVLSCYSLGNKKVLRTPPQFDKYRVNLTNGIAGIARGQNPSIINPRPLDLPVQIPRSNINAAFKTNISIPGEVF